MAHKNDDSTAQAMSLYSAEYPGVYALRLVNLAKELCSFFNLLFCNLSSLKFLNTLNLLLILLILLLQRSITKLSITQMISRRL